MESTIIYYTSNKEGSRLEEAVKKNILKVTNLPIISVSHKPIDFGENIAVGDVGVSGYNMFRQVQIACEKAKTKFVISAEADTLYPPDYFNFIPPEDDVCYRNSNLYVLRYRHEFYGKKENGATHAQIVGREYYLNRLNELFKGAPPWSPEEKNFPKERHDLEDVFEDIEYWESENPVVQVKTNRSMRWHTACSRTPTYNIDYWGEAKRLKSNFF